MAGFACGERDWKIRSGSARSKIDAGSIRLAKGCWKDSRWEAICSWSITRAGCFREGKATISRELAGIFDRLGSSAESWWARLEKLSRGRLLGRFFAASRDRLREVATHLGVHHLANLGGCPALLE